MSWFHGGSVEDVQQVKALGHFPAEYAPRRGNWGAGVYLTSSKKEAKQFGDVVISVSVPPSVKLLDMRDPTYRAMPSSVFDHLVSARAKAAFEDRWNAGDIPGAAVAGATADGYDGIVWKGDAWNDWAVVFDPTQVRLTPARKKTADVRQNPATPLSAQELVAAANKAFPKAGAVVDGRVVREKVDNTSSIASTFTRYHVLKGIREVPLSVFSSNFYASADDNARVEWLAAAIAESGEISPLIVVVDKEGVDDPYVLEGGHRAAALQALGAKSLPAMVVVDLDDADEDEARDNPLTPARKAPAMRKNPSNPALQALYALRDNWSAGGDMGEPDGFLVRDGDGADGVAAVYAVRLELWTDDCLMDLAKQTPAAAHRRGRALAKAWAKAHWPHTGYEEIGVDGVYGATWAFDKATASEQEKTDPEKVLDLTTRPRPTRLNPLMLDGVDDPFEPEFHKAASKARRKALCFHGTSSKFFWSIVQNGLSFDVTRKSWVGTSPGVFVAFNEQTTEGYAGTAVSVHGGAPLCFVLELPVKMLGIDIDDRESHDKDKNLQSMVLDPVPAKYITGVLLPEFGGWSTEIPIKDFLKDVQRGRYKNVLGLEPRKVPAPKTGKATPIDPEHAVLNYLVDVLNYTSLSHHLINPEWNRLSRKVLTALLRNDIPNWRMMNARQWLRVVEGLTGEKNEESYFDEIAEQPLYRRPFYEVASKFSSKHVDVSRGLV
jgi:hypothetical protein